MCYRYKIKHCESFFRDPRLYTLFLTIFSNEKYLGTLRSDLEFKNELKYLKDQANYINEKTSPEIQKSSKRLKKAERA